MYCTCSTCQQHMSTSHAASAYPLPCNTCQQHMQLLQHTTMQHMSKTHAASAYTLPCNTCQHHMQLLQSAYTLPCNTCQQHMQLLHTHYHATHAASTYTTLAPSAIEFWSYSTRRQGNYSNSIQNVSIPTICTHNTGLAPTATSCQQQHPKLQPPPPLPQCLIVFHVREALLFECINTLNWKITSINPLLKTIKALMHKGLIF